MTPEDYMSRAIELAKRGAYSVHPNPTVGCVLVRQDKIVGEGYHIKAGEGHAEANALANAVADVQGATAYVTLEPCSFHGRTPSCAGALIDAGVSKVVVGMLDPDPRNSGTSIEKLRAAGIEVVVPFMQDHVAELVKGQVLRYEQAKPYVRLKLAMTLDGKTALENGESRWITSEQSRRDVQRYRAMSGAIVTGVQTVIDDDPRLTVRREELDAEYADVAAAIKRPVYILDSKLRVPADAGLLSSSDTVLVAGCESTFECAAEKVVGELRDGRIDLKWLLSFLAEREHNEVLFECGSTLAGSLINEQLVDELIIYIAPTLMGDSAKSLLKLPEIDRMADLARVDIQDVRQFGPDIRVIATRTDQ